MTPPVTSARATEASQPKLRVATGRPSRVTAAIEPLLVDAPTVCRIDIDLTSERSANGDRDETASGLDTFHQGADIDGAIIVDGVELGVEAGIPIVVVVHSWGVDPLGGIVGIDAWGRAARAVSAASGQVPIVVIIDGLCLGSTALVAGLADVVAVTDRASMYLHDSASIARMTGITVDADTHGDATMHVIESGVAHLHSATLDDALAAVADLLEFLPPNQHERARRTSPTDPTDRNCDRAALAVPRDARQTYDVRDVVIDVVDDHDLFELQARYAPAIVIALARIDGRAVGIVANQPDCLAGALDIESSQKAARFVRFCDSFNLPLVTFVDTPGFRPGRDQEWRGIIRHGAQLAFAYAEATVPRLCVVLRKAYGGGYIVMDCKTMGNNMCVAWPSAEIAVMGAAGAVQILNRRLLGSLPLDERERAEEHLLADYEATFLTPRLALERGYVDEVIDPATTRTVLAGALSALREKRTPAPHRRHSNTPL